MMGTLTRAGKEMVDAVRYACTQRGPSTGEILLNNIMSRNNTIPDRFASGGAVSKIKSSRRAWTEIAKGWLARRIWLPEGFPDANFEVWTGVGVGQCRVPEHTHDTEQTVYVLAGEIEETVSGEVATPHSRPLVIPAGQLHGFRAIENSVCVTRFQPPLQSGA